MTDEHAKLTAQYEQIARALHATNQPSNELLASAVCHILARLGPPDAMDAVDTDVQSDLKAVEDGVDFLMLDFGLVRAPKSVSQAARQSISLHDFDKSDRFNAYLKRQNRRQEEFYAAGGDMSDFPAEEWS